MACTLRPSAPPVRPVPGQYYTVRSGPVREAGRRHFATVTGWLDVHDARLSHFPAQWPARPRRHPRWERQQGTASCRAALPRRPGSSFLASAVVSVRWTGTGRGGAWPGGAEQPGPADRSPAGQPVGKGGISGTWPAPNSTAPRCNHAALPPYQFHRGSRAKSIGERLNAARAILAPLQQLCLSIVSGISKSYSCQWCVASAPKQGSGRCLSGSGREAMGQGHGAVAKT